MADYYDKIISKICVTCLIEKEIKYFYKRKISKDGYRNTCKGCISEQSKKNHEKNKESLKKKGKEWRVKNKEKMRENSILFHKENPEYRRDYQINNREKINERYKKRRVSDSNFRLKENIRNLIKNSIKSNNYHKKSKTINILGCDNNTFKEYLESKFADWMSWGNYGNPKDGILESNKTWDLDHIIPISTATCEEDIIKLNHYTNFQPLCSYINRIIKRDKINLL